MEDPTLDESPALAPDGSDEPASTETAPDPLQALPSLPAAPGGEVDTTEARKIVDALQRPGMFDLLAALAVARKIPSSRLAAGIKQTAQAVERAKVEFQKTLNDLSDHSKAVEEFSKNLSKVKLTSLQFRLLDAVSDDLSSGAMDPKEKIALLQFIHRELGGQAERLGDRKPAPIAPEEYNKRLELLKGGKRG